MQAGGKDVKGYILRDISQAQMTLTKLFGPTLGGDAAVGLAEFGITRVHGMPSKDDLRLEGPGTVIDRLPTMTEDVLIGKVDCRFQ